MCDCDFIQLVLPAKLVQTEHRKNKTKGHRQDISPGVQAWALHFNNVSGKQATSNTTITQVELNSQ
jgi:hypothetical protein